MARVAEHLSIAELEERFRTAKDPILARHVQVIWLLAQGHTRGSLDGDQLRAALDRAVACPLQCRGLCGPGRPAPAQWARAEPAQAGPVGALARPPGRSAAQSASSWFCSQPLAQPQHGLEALDRAPGRVEGLKAADPGHGPLDPEVVALDPLL